VSTTELNLASHTNVLGDYFTTMGIPLLRGRAFTPADSVNDAPVIIVSESLARRYWPNQDPIGKRVKWGSAQSTSPWLTVVGIIGEVKQGPLDQATRPHTYSPYSEINDGRPSSVELRTSGDPEEFAADLRRVVAQLDPQLAVSEVRTMTEVIDESTAPRKATLLLLLVFAGSALLLAAIGIYGVVAYSVAQRTRELGIRLALGADRWQVLLMIFGSGIELILTGAILGTLGALATSRVMRQMLFEVKPADPLSLAGGAAVLIAIAALATYLPARRATKVDPMVTLRYE
jgi:putative ABC transport system permease protein